MRIYADNAATSHPKAPGVVEAIAAEAQRLYSPGRAGYRESLDAASLVRRTRGRLAELIGATGNEQSSPPDRIVLTSGTTDSLNLAIKGVVRHAVRTFGRAHVIATSIDHNAVLRPLHALTHELGFRPYPKLSPHGPSSSDADLARTPMSHPEQDLQSPQAVTFTLIRPREGTYVINPRDIQDAITPDTRLIVLNAVSNVTGAIQPIAEISAIRGDTPLLIDAAQLLGHLPFQLAQTIARDQLGSTMLAISSHKGLLGPAGIGAIYIGPGMENKIMSWRDGGTGTNSESALQPTHMPTRFEAGTFNMLGVAGFDASLDYVLHRGTQSLRAHELTLITHALSRIAAYNRSPQSARSQLTLHGPTDPRDRTAIFSLSTNVAPASILAATLESGFQVLCRAGLSCAPYALTDSGPSEGAVRISFGFSQTLADVDQVFDALAAAVALLTPS